MWAAKTGTPKLTITGAVMVAMMRYLAVVGTPSPRIMEANIHRKRMTIIRMTG